MIAELALKKFVNWASVTLVFCDVRSDSVRAISVTCDRPKFRKRIRRYRRTTAASPERRWRIGGGDAADIAEQLPRRTTYASQVSMIGFIRGIIGPA
jgi:hypothetical protein